MCIVEWNESYHNISHARPAMKLRFEHQSIRLRLSDTEVQQFLHSGVLQEVVRFGSSATEEFTYELLKTADYDQLHAERTASGLRIFFPSAWADEWALNKEKSWKYSQPLGQDTLQILVEMDQDCRH